MNQSTLLPTWFLLLFCLGLVGCISLIYSRGNWRTAIAFTSLTAFVFCLVEGINAWSNFIATHFVGQFDVLGIPFRVAGPGLSLVQTSWPLWLAPSSIITLISLGLAWWIFSPSSKAKTSPATVADSVSTLSQNAPDSTQRVAKQLELKSFRHELALVKERLAAAIEIAEHQVDKNYDLTIEFEQYKEESAATIFSLGEKITTLSMHANQ